MPCNEISGSSNQNSDAPKKRMEKTTQSSKQSARDFIKLSYEPTPENPGLYGGMWSGGDGAGTSDGSRSQYDKQVLDLMQKMMDRMQNLDNKLEQANQEKRDMEKTNRELTNKLKQAFREKEELVDQLKEARLGGTSSLQKGESSSLLINWEKLTSWKKYFDAHKFAQTPAGEAWFDKYVDDWVLTKDGRNYMVLHADKFFATKPGKRWFERKGVEWLESADGREYKRFNHAMDAWYREKTGRSLR